MTARRSRGDGGLHWDEHRQRWIASVTAGYTPAGKRIVRRGSGKTKTEAKNRLKEILRNREDGAPAEANGYTVAHSVEDWLAYGLGGRSANTITNRRILAETHIVGPLGARKLRDLSPEDVDTWLADRAKVVSTSTLQRVKSILRRAVGRAQAREKVRRNVVLLCDTPAGKGGRPSKALTLDQAAAVLAAAEKSSLRAYLTVSLMTGARTEELRPLAWSHVDLDGDPVARPLVKPHVMVWRSVREDGDTKTQKSRRSLALPARCVEVLGEHRDQQAEQRRKAGERWTDNDLVFASRVGTELNPANVRRGFRLVVAAAGLNPDDWTPRELRHSFVSLLSDSGMPVEKISLLVGHKGSHVTELVYRKQLRPVVEEGATVMDALFGRRDG
ncbi:MAG: tyrosine-type recombinase/integrase [Actinomycetota bacterium]|nr:tyrosine-type recombinase/integrase [Actinomycetota bacterium]